jgi:threonine/homoserine/homoserine lactone efflux protein
VTPSGSPVLTAFGIGVALAGAPGPVQAVLLGESLSGGVARGLRAWFGVHGTFALVMLLAAAGISAVSPGGIALRVLEGLGGAFLIWIAIEGVREDPAGPAAPRRHRLPPEARGSLAIVLNPGGWLFVATVASPLLGSANSNGGTALAMAAALVLVAGAALGDLGVILIGALGLRRARAGVVRLIQRALAVVLAGFGVWLLVRAVVG